MEKTKILIVAKTYPEISSKYTETVCTAGIFADTKRFVRLYPIRFRYLEGALQFKKYQWINAAISKGNADSRPESYSVDPNTIEVGEIIPANRNWEERRSWVLNENTIFPSVEALRTAQENGGISLGIVKPKAVKRVIVRPRDAKEVASAIAKKSSVVKQMDMFEEKRDLYILPVRIMVEFECQDPKCTGHSMSVLDWEFGQLYRKIINKPLWEDKIEAKILREICGGTRDTHIILGNMAGHPQTFCVLGFFWPPINRRNQMPLFN